MSFPNNDLFQVHTQLWISEVSLLSRSGGLLRVEVSCLLVCLDVPRAAWYSTEILACCPPGLVR